MHPFFRFGIALVAGVATFYFVFWFGGALLLGLHLPMSVSALVALVAAVTVGRYAWRRIASPQNGALPSILLGACIVGGIGFVVGFFGPILFAPEANQGPLLGLFITGPLGVLVGAIGGWLHWLGRGRRAADQGGS